MSAPAESVPASALHAGDFAVLKLPQGDVMCDIRRAIAPGRGARVVLIDYRTLEGETGTTNLLSTDLVLRAGHHGAAAA